MIVNGGGHGRLEFARRTQPHRFGSEFSPVLTIDPSGTGHDQDATTCSRVLGDTGVIGVTEGVANHLEHAPTGLAALRTTSQGNDRFGSEERTLVD